MNFLPHILRRSLRSIWENFYLNAVAASVICVSLLLLGVYGIVETNVSTTVEDWNKDVHISAYFSDSISEAERLELRDEIHGYPEVIQVRYVSEEDAKQWLIKEVESISDTLDELGDNALPASLEITLVPEMAHPQQVEEFAKKLNLGSFANIDYGVVWVERFNAFLRLFEMLGTLVGLLIVIATIFLVTNTIHLIIYNRREELEVTKLVGASDAYITVPLVFEGFVQGLLGSLSAISGLWVIHSLLSKQLQESFDINIISELLFLPSSKLFILILVGIGLGSASAFIASYRFLGKIS